ncbi:MAG TPA: hypothetical protein EYO33_15885 [Phycisphaerales bacterium]|nr:hypothetical protein [Phycisphaerales bacterium]
MNINVILKYAFIFAIGVYGVVGWIVCRQPLDADAQQAETVGLLLPILTGTYIMQILFEPFFTRRMMETQGEYNKNVMIVKLALFESGAIYGLLLTLITHDLNYLMGFGIAAMLLIFFRVPVPPARF